MSGNRFYPRPKQKNNGAQARLPKTAKQMERHLKGVANHRRIEILFLIAREEGISVEGISNNLRCNFKTISEHIRRLAQAGLIEKKYEGHYMKHKLAPYGRTFIAFLTSFSNSQEFENINYRGNYYGK
ncbi:MAG: winged helix-turn-helix domain-containing protein [Patescibacteria group bacterium]